MSTGDRLGFAGLIVTLFALAAFYYWSDRKWIGSVSLWLIVLLAIGWIFMETKQRRRYATDGHLGSDRHLTTHQKEQIRLSLGRFDASRIGIYTLVDKPERHRYAQEVEEVFRQAGWTPFRGKDLDPDTNQSIKRKLSHAGVLLMSHSQDNMPNLEPIVSSLEAAKIPHRTVSTHPLEFGLYTGGIDTSVPIIFIGPKVEPPAEP
jgi:hypothetical protein